MIQLWFDFSCPYAYLASRRAPALAAELGATLSWRPMLLGGVFRGVGAGDGPMMNQSAAKARHNLLDMHRWAEVLDVPFAMPPAHPMRTVRALRVLLALPQPAWPAAIAEIYAAYWQRGEDITSDEVLATALRRAGLVDADIDTAIACADSDEVKAELRRRTDEAIARGIFGAPAWILERDGKRVLLWGQDRMHWVAEVWRGWDPERAPPGGKRPPPWRRMQATTDPARTTALYFDVGSPFAYLALTQLEELTHRLELRPIALGALFKDLGTANVPLFDFVPAKRSYILADMQRWARWWGVPLAMPAKFPQRTLAAQRLCIVASRRGAPVAVQLGLALALASAMWADGRDVADEAVLASVLAARDLPADWLAQTQDPAVKTALADNTAAARAAGVFGVPTFAVGDTLIWGQDRLDLVARLLDPSYAPPIGGAARPGEAGACDPSYAPPIGGAARPGEAGACDPSYAPPIGGAARPGEAGACDPSYAPPIGDAERPGEAGACDPSYAPPIGGAARPGEAGARDPSYAPPIGGAARPGEAGACDPSYAPPIGGAARPGEAGACDPSYAPPIGGAARPGEAGACDPSYAPPIGDAERPGEAGACDGGTPHTPSGAS